MANPNPQLTKFIDALNKKTNDFKQLLKTNANNATEYINTFLELHPVQSVVDKQLLRIGMFNAIKSVDSKNPTWKTPSCLAQKKKKKPTAKCAEGINNK